MVVDLAKADPVSKSHCMVVTPQLMGIAVLSGLRSLSCLSASEYQGAALIRRDMQIVMPTRAWTFILNLVVQ
eukprot:4598128-Amphidinium_carterae.1